MNKVIWISSVLFLSCAQHFSLEEKVSRFNICPNMSYENNDSVAQAYLRSLSELKEENIGINQISCTDSTLPNLKINFSRTSLAGSSERWKSLGITSLGIAAPIVMIATGTPFFITFWSIPQNQMFYNLSFTDSLQKEPKLLFKDVSTTSFSGSKQEQIAKQSNLFKQSLKQEIVKYIAKKD